MAVFGNFQVKTLASGLISGSLCLFPGLLYYFQKIGLKMDCFALQNNSDDLKKK